MRALIAMSGGVDSSVAALLMKEKGFDCTGCTMRLYENDMIGEDLLSTCCSLKDTGDARAVCERIGIPYHIFHYENEFRDLVIEPFVASYERGETPNPCIECNRRLKFSLLYDKAKELGCDTIVTGHYARIDRTDGRFLLKKALDTSKDQSYVLYNMGQEELSRTMFPLGELTKDEVRRIAGEHGFVNSGKKDSQDICFVPDGDYAGMIRRYREGKDYPSGDFIGTDGEVLGRHEGIINYTIGQRRGLRLPAGERIYVKDIDPDRNTVTLSDNNALFRKSFKVRSVNWISGTEPSGEVRALVKIRYRHREQPASIKPCGDMAEITFDEAQRAITPGQAAVFYDIDGETVLGGGVIIREELEK